MLLFPIRSLWWIASGLGVEETRAEDQGVLVTSPRGAVILQ